MKIKKFMCIWGFSFFVLFLAFASGISSAKVYQVYEAELMQLEQNFVEQETLLIQALSLQELQKSELQGLKMQLETALSELVASKKEMRRLKISLEEASDSIGKANSLFGEYEKEARQTQKRIGRQRNLWQIFFFCAGIYGISR